MFDFLSKKFSNVLSWVKDKGRLTEQNIQEAVNQVKEALLEADVPYELIEDFLTKVKNEIIGQKVQTSLNPGQQLIKVVHDQLLEFLGGKSAIPLTNFQIPSVIMVMGLQGSGKTTTIAKLAKFISEQAKKRDKTRKILLASVDFYRPAAIDQLEILAKQVGVDFYRASSSDTVNAAKEIYEKFKSDHYEYLFLDTAGRLHIDNQMMEELINIDHKLAPKYKILVLDAMTGQESLKVARAFDQTVGFNTAILTKMDSDTRGGAAFAFRYSLKKPISFVGCGEKIDDLESFVPERMASRILGMGDILTLIEKAEENIDYQEQESISRRMMAGNFTLKDFADQLGMVDRLGSLQKIARYLPGMGEVSPDMMEKGQVEMKRFKAIISSMTEKERLMPGLLDASRKKRVASGSGVLVTDINQLLQKFEQSKQFVKMLKKGGRFGKFFK
ncbi:signal recognition particle protein [Candidatus Babeliales bacterium]|nr:signal recognition particle protein [Candidatus Babeliales bacterium]MCF7899540.1 signal recognition particle protein [Candidatus Babeliales bacterium]